MQKKVGEILSGPVEGQNKELQKLVIDAYVMGVKAEQANQLRQEKVLS